VQSNFDEEGVDTSCVQTKSKGATLITKVVTQEKENPGKLLLSTLF
jgi:hypothetical protein